MTIIVTAMNYPMEMRTTGDKQIDLETFCKLAYYGYSSITVDGKETSIEDARRLICGS